MIVKGDMIRFRWQLYDQMIQERQKSAQNPKCVPSENLVTQALKDIKMISAALQSQPTKLANRSKWKGVQGGLTLKSFKK